MKSFEINGFTAVAGRTENGRRYAELKKGEDIVAYRWFDDATKQGCTWVKPGESANASIALDMAYRRA